MNDLCSELYGHNTSVMAATFFYVSLSLSWKRMVFLKLYRTFFFSYFRLHSIFPHVFAASGFHKSIKA